MLLVLMMLLMVLTTTKVHQGKLTRVTDQLMSDYTTTNSASANDKDRQTDRPTNKQIDEQIATAGSVGG